jgi:hypothetical protein
VHCEEIEPSTCAGLDPCQCFDRADCRPVSDDCICDCDYMCPGHAECDCDCGGGTYLGCESVDASTGG